MPDQTQDRIHRIREITTGDLTQACIDQAIESINNSGPWVFERPRTDLYNYYLSFGKSLKHSIVVISNYNCKECKDEKIITDEITDDKGNINIKIRNCKKCLKTMLG